MPVHQAARLDQAGGAERGLAHHQARAEADAAGELVRLAGERGADVERGLADRDTRAGFQLEPRHQRRVGYRAVDAVAFGERRVERSGRIETNLAEQRVVPIDRLHLDQRRLSGGVARHGAQGGGARQAALFAQKVELGRGCRARDQRKGEIAAEDDLALPRQTGSEARRHRADAGNGHAAERDADDEHVEAAQPPPQFPQAKRRGRALTLPSCFMAPNFSCHSGTRRRRGPGIQGRRRKRFVVWPWIPGSPLRARPGMTSAEIHAQHPRRHAPTATAPRARSARPAWCRASPAPAWCRAACGRRTEAR